MKKRPILKKLLISVTVFCLVFTFGFLTGCRDGENNSISIRDIIKAFGIGSSSDDYDLVISELNADNYGVKAEDPEGDGDGDGDDPDTDDLDADGEDTDGVKAVKDAYHIISSSNKGGTITGSVDVDTGNSNFSVTNGGSISFEVTAEEGYYIVYIRIGNKKTDVNALSFSILIESVGSNSTIHAQFKKGEIPVVDSESGTSGNKGKGKGNNK